MKVKFVRNNAGAVGLAHAIGEVAEFEEAFAQGLIEGGFCVKVEAPESDLPVDLLHRSKLINAGLDSLAKLQEAIASGALKSVKGIGAKAQQEIEQYFTETE
jgi:DNA polymerase/3'-5' exonuclease PolX